MKIKKIFYLLIIIFLTFICSNCNKKIKLYNYNNLPTIDFIQPWAFYQMNNDELMNHFTKLKAKGIKKVIIQNVSNYKQEEGLTCYYDTKYQFKNVYPDFLKNTIASAKSLDMEVIVGLSSDSYWWNYDKHQYNSQVMNSFYLEDEKVIQEVLSKYKIDGIYFANEMYSNPHNYSKAWSTHLNKIISLIESIDDKMPFYISPFNSSAFTMTNNQKINEWKFFFKKVNFRDFDYFLLQDGFGGLTKDFDEKIANKIFTLNREIRDVCLKHSKCNFILNVELFAKDGYTTKSRLKKQIEYANLLGTSIACFSVSHYFINDDDIFKIY